MAADVNALGPYDTEGEALTADLPHEVRALHAAGLVGSGDPHRLVHGAVLRHLVNACTTAGVDLGHYDHRVLNWLATWEPQTAQVLIGLISRAHAAGQQKGNSRG